MPVLVAVAGFAFLVHFCFAAVEDEHSDSELVVCLVVAAEAAQPSSELFVGAKELLVTVAGSCCLDLV